MLFTVLVSWLVSSLQAQESPLGPKVVQMRNAAYYKNPPPPREAIGAPLYGDRVTVLAVEGRYSKVRLSDGKIAYIAASALVSPEKFVPDPESEEEKTRLNAQNFKAGRFDSATETEYIKEKGPKMEQAYKDVAGLMARPAYKSDRAELERQLAAFRKEGKLGEFSSVR
jgi:hypothetical protein